MGGMTKFTVWVDEDDAGAAHGRIFSIPGVYAVAKGEPPQIVHNRDQFALNLVSNDCQGERPSVERGQ